MDLVFCRPSTWPKCRLFGFDIGRDFPAILTGAVLPAFSLGRSLGLGWACAPRGQDDRFSQNIAGLLGFS
jgi:hypothetical protein